MTVQTLESQVIKKTLANGLTVLVKEDHAAPIVAVNVWFGVGSVHETEEINGLAHFQEHMVFKGTEKYAVGEIASLVRAAGGNLNASTSFSFTQYYIVLPSNALSTALEIQADAMMNSTFDPEEFMKERQVVIGEARMYDDRPESFVFYRTMELGFEKHNYRRPIAGYEPIVQEITRDQLVDFYDNYYRPSNAVLVVVGDVDPADTLAKIEKFYGGWQRRQVRFGESPVEPPQRSFRFKAYNGSMDHGYFGAGFHVPNILHEDYPALEMLSELLSTGRSARLYRRVLEEKRLVTSVSTGVLAESWPGFFMVRASMSPEKFESACEATFAEIEKLKHEPVSPEELRKARRQLERSMLKELETMEGQASNLGYYHLLGDHNLADLHREAIKRVTPEEVMAVARRYCHPSNLSLVTYLPEGFQCDADDTEALINKTLSSEGGVNDMGDSPHPSTVTASHDTAEIATRPRKAAGGGVKTFELENGVRVLVKERRDVPLVSMLTLFQGGSRFEPAGKSGVATLAHRAIVKGSQRFSAEDIAVRIEGAGGSINSFADYDTGGISLGVVSEYLDETLSVYRDVVRAPAFDEERVTQERERLLEEVKSRHDNPIQLTMDSLFRNVFDRHPYSHPFWGDVEEGKLLTGADCAEWYRSLLVPASVVVAFVGDVSEEKARDIAEDLFGDLVPGPIREPEFKVPSAVMSPGEHIVRRPDLKQAVTFVGFLAPKMMTDESMSLQVLNGILAGLGGRLFVELRDKRSLGYMTGSAFNPFFESGLFFGYANPTADRVDEAVEVIFTELEKVAAEKVTEQELARSKEWLIGSHAMQLQRNAAQASAYASYESLGFGWNVVDTAPERVNAVTRESIRDVAASMFERGKAAVIKMLPSE